MPTAPYWTNAQELTISGIMRGERILTPGDKIVVAYDGHRQSVIVTEVRVGEHGFMEWTAEASFCRHDDPDNSGLCIKCGIIL